MTYLHKLIDLAEANRTLDPFYEEKTSEEFFEWMLEEIDEWKEEYAKWDFEELESEMWDVIWDFFLLVNKLEDEWKINKERIFEKMYNKISSRKSFLLEWRKVDKDEAMKIWNDAKRKEWYSEDRLWKAED